MSAFSSGIEVGSAFVTIGADTSPLRKAEEEVQATLQRIGNMTGGGQLSSSPISFPTSPSGGVGSQGASVSLKFDETSLRQQIDTFFRSLPPVKIAVELDRGAGSGGLSGGVIGGGGGGNIVNPISASGLKQFPVGGEIPVFPYDYQTNRFQGTNLGQDYGGMPPGSGTFINPWASATTGFGGTAQAFSSPWTSATNGNTPINPWTTGVFTTGAVIPSESLGNPWASAAGLTGPIPNPWTSGTFTNGPQGQFASPWTSFAQQTANTNPNQPFVNPWTSGTPAPAGTGFFSSPWTTGVGQQPAVVYNPRDEAKLRWMFSGGPPSLEGAEDIESMGSPVSAADQMAQYNSFKQTATAVSGGRERTFANKNLLTPRGLAGGLGIPLTSIAVTETYFKYQTMMAAAANINPEWMAQEYATVGGLESGTELAEPYTRSIAASQKLLAQAQARESLPLIGVIPSYIHEKTGYTALLRHENQIAQQSLEARLNLAGGAAAASVEVPALRGDVFGAARARANVFENQTIKELNVTKFGLPNVTNAGDITSLLAGNTLTDQQRGALTDAQNQLSLVPEIIAQGQRDAALVSSSFVYGTQSANYQTLAANVGSQTTGILRGLEPGIEYRYQALLGQQRALPLQQSAQMAEFRRSQEEAFNKAGPFNYEQVRVEQAARYDAFSAQQTEARNQLENEIYQNRRQFGREVSSEAVGAVAYTEQVRFMAFAGDARMSRDSQWEARAMGRAREEGVKGAIEAIQYLPPEKQASERVRLGAELINVQNEKAQNEYFAARGVSFEGSSLQSIIGSSQEILQYHPIAAQAIQNVNRARIMAESSDFANKGLAERAAVAQLQAERFQATNIHGGEQAIGMSYANALAASRANLGQYDITGHLADVRAASAAYRKGIGQIQSGEHISPEPPTLQHPNVNSAMGAADDSAKVNAAFFNKVLPLIIQIANKSGAALFN